MLPVRSLKHPRGVRRTPRTKPARKAPVSPHATSVTLRHPYPFWMVATLAAFPAVMTIATMFGLGPLLAFVAGAIGSLLVLLLNILLEHEFWMLNSHWRFRFEDPEFSHRLVVLSGALLLMVQTSFFLFFLIDQPFAAHVFRLLLLDQG